MRHKRYRHPVPILVPNFCVCVTDRINWTGGHRNVLYMLYIEVSPSVYVAINVQYSIMYSYTIPYV